MFDASEGTPEASRSMLCAGVEDYTLGPLGYVGVRKA